jgi:hypothetical protein
MLSLFGNSRLWLLIFGIAVAAAIVATVPETYYSFRIAAVSNGLPSDWLNIVSVGNVRDPVDVENLWPNAEPVLSLKEVSRRLPEGRWASVEAAAVKSVTESPLSPRMWLVLAIARAVRHAEVANVAAALKMSFDTGRNEAAVLVPRLLLSVELDFSSDAELTADVRYEVQRALTGPQGLRPILIAARCMARPQARKLIDDIAHNLERTSEEVWDVTC